MWSKRMTFNEQCRATYLRNLPVHTSSCCDWHCSQIDNKVSDLAKEIILVAILTDSARQIRIGIKNGDPNKRRSSLDCGKSDSIPYELSVV